MPDYIEATPPLERLANFVAGIPPQTKKIVWAAIGKYFLGTDSHGLRHYPPDRYVSREQAGYKTSPAQMRFFFATGILESDGHGGIRLNRYQRTEETKNGWTMMSTENGLSLKNIGRGVYYTEGPAQANQPRLVGWRMAADIVLTNINGAIRSAQQAVNKWLADLYEKG